MLQKIIQKIKRDLKIKHSLYFVLFILLFANCSKESPISAVYQSTKDHLSATIIDSTLYLMIGLDTAIIYNLQIHTELQIEENTYRIYNVVYSNSLNRHGYTSIGIPLEFVYSKDFGGTLIASFINNDSFTLGGYSFKRAESDRAKKIFDNWSNLILNNTQTRLWNEFQE